MADVTKITLLEDRVLVRAKGIEQKTASGIIIPDTATSEKPEQGEILSVGPGLVNEDGTVRPLTVKVGQMVLFTKYSPNEIKVDNEDFLIIREKDILAIVG
ncbi:co-chaperone GroES [candidate division WWE3 bacterium CG_4_9_14_3_um_filter_41_6]|uniref:Co-chaperonin GroES n=1 Tax=candidate division WWE3 bacterium CG_4_10_14_0_2_um_filter_41_14 TaxID=1975072 RepID=A0A2M7TIK2_UNCKA|nr:MAG: co-chaperone GroES [candidate division WWE3 bacterium CG_4_10_14_0_2_um_filter_41_14]PJA38895.1 MAG: co-chaperone GroES [candidate division WWE3 bacterium CG_4_9_14_3_um_filter_41_6]